MYLNFYGFKEYPFDLSPNPVFLYRSVSLIQAMRGFLKAVASRTHFMLLTGESGIGKTTLANALLPPLRKNRLVGRIYYTLLGRSRFMQHMCKEFSSGCSGYSFPDLLNHLQRLSNRPQPGLVGKPSLLILDEAQNLNQNILSDIQFLCDFEKCNRVPLFLMMIGQPDLEHKLRMTRIGSTALIDKIGLHHHLTALTRVETEQYIYHRLQIGGCPSSRILFSKEATDRIFRLSSGIPAQVNLLCHHALRTAYQGRVFEITLQHVDRGLAEYRSHIQKRYSEKSRAYSSGEPAGMEALQQSDVAANSPIEAPTCLMPS